MKALRPALCCLALSSAACKKKPTPTPLDTTLALGCVVGSARVCTCTGEDSGVALCKADGSGFGDCDCTLFFSSAVCTGVTSAADEHLCVTPLPTCVLVPPAHSVLNGVPVSLGGDRQSSDGAPYQASLGVTSDSAKRVIVDVDSGDHAAAVFSGMAAQVTVTLVPDGTHTLLAHCVAQNGAMSDSQPLTVSVDTTPPTFNVTAPADGTHFGPSEDADPTAPGQQIAICTSSTDAVQLCAAIGTANGTCGAIAGSGCVNLDCPGGAPFDVNISAFDAANNRATGHAKAVSCAAKTPSVQIVDPVATVMGDATTRILSADGTNPRKDQDGATPGAQYSVVACTDAGGGAASLAWHFGMNPENPLATADLLAAVLTDNCPPALGYAAHFAVTLPESREAADGTLLTATTLVASVTDASGEPGASPAVDVWVDSEAPVVQSWYPAPICGYYDDPFPATTYTQGVSFAISAPNRTLTVTNGPTGTTYMETTPGGPIAYFNPVAFPLGDNHLRVDASEPSGNATVYPSSGDCIVTVSNVPRVTFTSPFAANITGALNLANDGVPATTGQWEGTLTVTVDTADAGVTVSFTQDGTPLAGSPVSCVVSSTTCTASLPVTLTDTPSTTIAAQTSDVTGRGVGQGSLGPRLIDTVAPAAPDAVTVSVLDRRRTAFSLGWDSLASESIGAIATYDVRYAKAVGPSGASGPSGVSGASGVSCDQAATSSGPRVAFLGTPRAPGQPESIAVGDLVIETDYCFSVAAVDTAGNEGPATLSAPTRASFNLTILTPDVSIGSVLPRRSMLDLNHDGLTDLVIGSYDDNRLLVHYGTANGYQPAPDVVFTGPADSAFGFTAVGLGDLDGDGRIDLGISASVEGPGRVYVFRGRDIWPAELDSSQADMIISLDTAADPNYLLNDFGYPLAPVGDWDGDGADDFAVGHYGYNWNDQIGGGIGGVDIVFGVKAPMQLPRSLVLPQALGTQATFISEPTSPRYEFGFDLMGIGNFYSGSKGGVVGTQSPDVTGLVMLAFAGDGTRDARSGFNRARNTTSGPANNIDNQPQPGGPWLGTFSVITSHYGNGPLTFSATSGSSTVGPFAGVVTHFHVDPSEIPIANNSGYAIASGFDASPLTVSFIGRDTPDLIFFNYGKGAPTFYFVTGETWARLAGTDINLTTDADLKWTAPLTWPQWTAAGTSLKDSNGDGYADFVFSETDYTSAFHGRVVVVW